MYRFGQGILRSLVAGVVALSASGCADRFERRDVATAIPPTAGIRSDDVVLRYECTMGPIREPDDRICFGPAITVYGNGTVVFRDIDVPVAIDGGVRRYPAFEVARLTPEATAALIASARKPLEAAAAIPDDPDAPFADPLWWDVFTVATGGGTMTLTPGLGPVPPRGADLSTVALQPLIDRLEQFRPAADELAEPVGSYSADRICLRAFVDERAATEPWPLPDLDRREVRLGLAGTTAASFELPAEAADRLVPDVGGARGFLVVGPDGHGSYTLEFRVLMPDEDCAGP